MSCERTSRGFRAPSNLVEEIGHEDDRFLVVRLTPWELRQTRIEESGVAIRLLKRPDGTYDGICYEPAPATEKDEDGS